jgi:hypothetical protein
MMILPFNLDPMVVNRCLRDRLIFRHLKISISLITVGNYVLRFEITDWRSISGLVDLVYAFNQVSLQIQEFESCGSMCDCASD